MKKNLYRKIEPDTNSKIITQIEIQKEINTNHIIFHIGFSNLLKENEQLNN
jgi:small subunit ribosomal protein S3